MNRAVFGTLLVAAVACVAVLSWSLPQQAVNAQPGAKAQQWEYKVVKTDFAQPEQQFNNLGADGWEYAGGYRTGLDVIFKRPKR